MGILASSMIHPEEALVITFTAEGTVEALHKDEFDLGFLGRKSITRATDIALDEDEQTWTIHLLSQDGQRQPALKNARGFQTYEIARKVEVGWLNLSRLNEVAPDSSCGCVFLNQARKALGLSI